jgi:NarL family two-component system sensor histidine kinase YdfH
MHSIGKEEKMRMKLSLLWPFLWLFFAWIYVVIPFPLISAIDLGTSNQIFTGLLIIHAILYVLGSLPTFPYRWYWPYIVLQDGLIIGMGLALSSANTFIISITLYLALVGKSISLRRGHKAVILTLVSAAVSFLIGVTIRGGWIAFHHAILYVAPVILVAAGYIALSFRLARANEKSQTLLRELEEAHDILARYAAQVEDLTRANERQRMARELHDTLAQGLAGLTMQLDAVDALLEEDNAREAQEIVQQAIVRSRTTLVDARKAIDDLRNTDSETLDCREAVQREVLHFTTTTGIACQADLTALVLTAPSLHEYVLRVVTESLWNVARHAQAHHVWVHTSEQNGTLTIEISDDGIGFDTSHTATRTGHYGLIGLRERARLIGGHLEIKSTPGRGTTICFMLPVENVTISRLVAGNIAQRGAL